MPPRGADRFRVAEGEEVRPTPEGPTAARIVSRGYLPLRVRTEGEVQRDRVAYGPRLVRAAQVERERARTRERLRPLRWLLYPALGLLPEEQQDRACDRLGLYAVTATLVSGLVESLAFLGALWLASRAAVLLLAFVLPGLGRAFSAVAFRETAGSWPVILGSPGRLVARPGVGLGTHPGLPSRQTPPRLVEVRP
jgi:hypothetical protein